MQQTTQSTWTLRCEGTALVMSDGRHQERWDVTRPWTARDMREALHAVTGNGLADGPVARAASRGFTRQNTTLPDGTFETQWGESPKARPTPAPTCDSPHCACVDGTDCPENRPCDCNDADDCRIDIGSGWRPKGCKGWVDGVEDGPRADGLDRWQQANVPDAARVARDLAAKLRARHVPLWTLSWQGDRFQIQDGVVTATTDGLAPDATVQESVVAINALVRGMRLNMIAMESVVAFQDDGNGKVTPIYGPPPVDAPPAPDLAARLDGLKASVDALAERLDRKATDLPKDPLVARLDRKRAAARPVWIVKLQKVLTVSGQGTVWVIDTKSRKDDFDFGDCVTDHEGGDIMEVVGIASQEGNHTVGLTVRRAKN